MSKTTAGRYAVGRVDGTGEKRRFDTMEQVHEYQATLPRDDLAQGEFYLDDLEAN